MYSIYFKKSLSAAIPSFDIRYSTFCGSLFNFVKSHMSAASGLKNGQSDP